MIKNPVIDALRLDGGVLCLNFLNTVPDRREKPQKDHLKGFEDLLYWARKAGIVDRVAFAEIQRHGEANRRKAMQFFSESLELRSLIYSLFLPISKKQRVRLEDMDVFNKLSQSYFSHLELTANETDFREHWNLTAGHFHNITGPIVKSAYDLLLSDKLDKVKECPNCGWLFLDTTKNGRRRWCSMEDCGSNVKALEYYYRNRKKK